MLKDLPSEEFAALVSYMDKVNSGQDNDDGDMSIDEFDKQFG